MINLWCGDCLELMKNIPDSSVDAVICDPPYGTTRCKWDSIIPLDKMWGELDRVAHERTAFVFTASQPFTSMLVMSNQKLFKYSLVWEKPSGTGFFNAKKMPMRNHEDILVFYKKLPVYNPQKTNGHERKTAGKKAASSEHYGKPVRKTFYDSTERYPRSVLKFSSEKQSNRGLHPCLKPLSLMEYLVKTFTNTGDHVLDFAMGSGTTGVACKKNGRFFTGIEKDKGYFETAKDRISNY